MEEINALKNIKFLENTPSEKTFSLKICIRTKGENITIPCYFRA